MHKSISKKVGIMFMIVSLLSLIGCGSLDQRQAKQIEKKLSEMYEGKTFEVLALGNRWGTLTNDTVTAHVREVERDVVFVVKMNTKGDFVVNNYSISAVLAQLEDLLNTNLKKEGITTDSLLDSYGGKEVSQLNPNASLIDYISNYKPDYISGDLVIKESENNTGEAFIKAYRKTFEEIQQTYLQTHVWVIRRGSYEEVINEFSGLPEVSDDWFDDKNVLSYFPFYIDENGVTNLKEEEVDRLLRGGG